MSRTPTSARARLTAVAIAATVALTTSLASRADANVGPVSAVTGAPTSPEGAPYVLTLAGIDANGDDASLLFAVDWGDGTPTSTVLLSPGPVTHTFLDGLRVANVLVMIYDQAGGATRVDLPLTVLDVAPTTTLDGPAAATVDQAYPLTIGALVDPGRDTATSTVVHWGDGTSDATTPGSTIEHVYRTPGPANVTVEVTDEDGTHVAATRSALVADAAPPAPTGLTAAATSRSTVRLAWTNATTNQTAVQIDRCKGLGCTSFRRIATVSGAATGFTDGRLSPNTIYVYRVRARNVVGVSPWSASARTRTFR